MKKKILTILVALFSFVLVFAVTACGGDDNGGGSAKWKITFDYNYEGAPESVVKEVENGARVTPPADPTRSGHAFEGWYTSAACTTEADFGRAVSANATYFAGWRQTAVTITFDLNYDGAQSITESVNLGGTVSRPVSPEREGYLFVGWYKSKTDFSDDNLFDFTTTISEATTIYASWEADTGDNVRITYNYNYTGAPNGGVYDKTVQKTNKRYPVGVTCTRDGYYFYGWYKDADCTVKPTATERVREDVTLYARWLNIYTFEAEAVDLTGLEGMGYSGNASGTQMITHDDYNMGASGEYYVGCLYSPNLTLEFHITSEEENSDAVLAMRISAEFQDITLTDEKFLVEVNGEKVSYPSLPFVGVPNGSADTKMPFSTFVLTGTFNLKKGDNVIKLIVNNNEKGEGGTMNATAPMVDCIYIYSDIEVAWAAGYPMNGDLTRPRG